MKTMFLWFVIVLCVLDFFSFILLIQKQIENTFWNRKSIFRKISKDYKIMNLNKSLSVKISKYWGQFTVVYESFLYM